MAVTKDLASPEDVGFSTERLARIDEYIDRSVISGRLPGAVTIVGRRGRVVHEHAAGAYARDAIFRLASMTKPVTCVAALILFEEGRFLLDDPVADFLPEFTATRVFSSAGAVALERPISIRHLLTHTSGIAYDFTAEPALGDLYRKAISGAPPDESLGDRVRRLATLPLNHQPGAGWTYGYSHDVLGRLIEVIADEPFEGFLRRRIFEPLEMSDTDFHHTPGEANRMATVFASRGERKLEPVDRPDLDRSRPPARAMGGAGLISTAGDYARFCQMLLNGGALGDLRLLGRKTVELMATNQTGPTSPFPPSMPPEWTMSAYGYGLGVRVLMDVSKSNAGGSVGEYGWSGAQSTYFWIDPAESLFGVFMTQLEDIQLRYARTVQALTYQALVD